MIDATNAERIRTTYRLACSEGDPLVEYFVAIDSRGRLPEPAELAQLASYQEYVVRKYHSGPAAERLLADVPAEPFTNSLVLYPDPDGGWRCRRVTWSVGPYRYPSASDAGLPLVELLDWVEDLLPEGWAAWKHNHSAELRG